MDTLWVTETGQMVGWPGLSKLQELIGLGKAQKVSGKSETVTLSGKSETVTLPGMIKGLTISRKDSGSFEVVDVTSMR
ncbi:MAG: hypothetical protein ABEK59_10490 [Halobacteria archaeon]